MPWVLNRTVEPPANPLVMSQPSFRAGDLDNVGLGSGRHCSIFEMMAHHAFNNKNVYWKEETTELCFNWLKELKINPELIIFKENWWEGGGNAGPCFEVLIKGNEVATLVFMEYEGPFNGNYKKMDMKVVDTGYGLERHVWGSTGTPTIYDSIYPNLVEWMAKKAGLKQNEKLFSEFCKTCGILNIEEVNVDLTRDKIIKEISRKLSLEEKEIKELILPFHNIYQILDHTKAIMFILSDGVVPSNVQEGYLARLLIRRVIRSLEDLGLNIPVSEIIEKQVKDYKKTFPEFEENKEDIIKMVDIEKEKYSQTLNKGKELAKKLITGKVVDDKTLTMLYDSHGLLPRDIKRFLPDVKMNLSDIETKIAAQKSSVKIQEKKDIDVRNIPETKKSYYENEKVFEFKAKVLKVDGDNVILDHTYFYPRGGGAEPDFGKINGFKVYDVESVGNVIIHKVKGHKIKEGSDANCVVDKERREQIKKHHTATHIINGAAKKVLGNHVWQAGSKKDVDKAHLDITHYENLSEKEIEEIEKIANDVVKKSLKVNKFLLTKNDAERKYGFTIYQGGVVPSKQIRIIEIPTFDVEACGGIHCDNTSEVGDVAIIKTERPQDGIARLIYTSGQAAEKYLRGREMILKECSKILNASERDLVKAIKDLIEEWKEKRKRLEILLRESAKKKSEKLEFEESKGLKFLIKEVENADMNQLQEISRRLSKEDTVIFLMGILDKIYLFAAAGEKAVKKGINVGKIISSASKELGGNGGGRAELAQGFGLEKKKAKDVLFKIKKDLIK